MSLIKAWNSQQNIKHWQQFLVSQGYNIKVDGDFGKNTKTATIQFQKKYGLDADGVVGQNSMSQALALGFTGFLAQTVPGKVILLSAGHTNFPGQDRGVVANGLIEGVEAVIVRDAVAKILRSRGYSVITDGADGVNDPLSKAISLAHTSHLAIEFHFNAFTNPTATGVESLSLPKHKTKAQRLSQTISNTLGLRTRGDSGWLPDTGGQHSRLAFCRVGGIIVELCFLTNKSDVAVYQSRFDKLTIALADIIGEIL